MSSFGRRKFFNKLSLGALGTMVLSVLPSNLFGKKKHELPSNIKVKLHPSSIKRNK